MVKVLPKRIFAFHRKRGTACMSSSQMRVEVGVRPFDRLGLLTAHRERLVMRAGEPLPGAQLGEHGLHVPDRAAHPFQFGVLEASS